MTDAEKEAWLDDRIREIAEHFDTVHVFATWMNDDGSTSSTNTGRGNWHARSGQVRAFVKRMDAQIWKQENGSSYQPPPESEEWKES